MSHLGPIIQNLCPPALREGDARIRECSRKIELVFIFVSQFYKLKHCTVVRSLKSHRQTEWTNFEELKCKTIGFERGLTRFVARTNEIIDLPAPFDLDGRLTGRFKRQKTFLHALGYSASGSRETGISCQIDETNTKFRKTTASQTPVFARLRLNKPRIKPPTFSPSASAGGASERRKNEVLDDRPGKSPHTHTHTAPPEQLLKSDVFCCSQRCAAKSRS